MNKLLAPLLVVALLGIAWFLIHESAPMESTSATHQPSQEIVEEPALKEATLEAPNEPEVLDRVDLVANPDLENNDSETNEAPDYSFATVRVVNEIGTPIEGVPVVILRHEPWSVVAIGHEVTDAEGYATLRDTPYYGPGSKKPTDISIGFPFPVKGASKAHKFSNESWPREPIVFTLPETGAMRVHLVDRDGEPWTHSAEVHIAPYSMFSGKGKAIKKDGMANTGRESINGVAFFPHVGLGYKLEVGMAWDQWAEWEILRVSGPQEAGETVDVTLRATKHHPTWRMRLIDADGKTFPNREVMVQTTAWMQRDDFAYQTMGFVGNFVVADNGILEFPFRNQIEGESPLLKLTVGPSFNPNFAFGTMPIDPNLRGQSADFGDQIVQTRAPLVSGQVHNAEGDPLDPYVRVLQVIDHPLLDHDDPQYENVEGVDTVIQDDGTFVTTGVSLSSLLKVTFQVNGYVQQELLVDLGTTDLDIVMQTDLGIAGQLQVPEGFQPNEFLMVFLAGTEVPDRRGWTNQGTTAIPSEQGDFRVAGLSSATPGVLAVYHDASGALLKVVNNLAPAPTTAASDPRLMPLSLDNLFRYKVLVEGSGSKTPSFLWSVLVPEHPAGYADSYSFGGDIDLILQQQTATIGILADGYRYLETEIAPGLNEFELERAPLVQFHAPDLPRLPEGFQYFVELDSLDGPTMLNQSGSPPQGIGGGVFPVPMPASGRFAIQLSVRNTATEKIVPVLRDAQAWNFAFEIREDAVGQRIDVPIPVDAIQVALEEAQKDKKE